jgi:hypothetical protein
MAAFLDLETAQGHADAARAVGERIRLAARFAVIDRLFAPQLNDAAVPQNGMLPLSASQVAKNLGPHGVSVPLGQGEIGVVGLDLGLPVFFKSLKDLFELRGTED